MAFAHFERAMIDSASTHHKSISVKTSELIQEA